MYKIDVAINLSRIKADAYGNLWVSSRGNYDDVPSNLYRLEPNGIFSITVSIYLLSSLNFR